LMAEEAFLVDRTDGILTLSFNRPEHGNAIPTSTIPLLTELFLSAGKDPSVKVIVVRGEGKHFSAGGDVQGFARSLEQSVEERRADFAPRLDRVAAMVEAYLALDIPVIAACRGGVAGAGLMYALGADYVYADETAAFVFAHQRVGLIPDSGVSYLLPRVVGERRALQLVLGAGRIDVQEAQRIGIVSQIVDAEGLDMEAQKLAQKLARGPSSVMRAAKRLIQGSLSSPLSKHVQAERDAIVICVGEAAFEEGVRAFIEKRSPDFSQV
jgi:2-(1,2-epoxy-1,2-dihydrophenyl)acetyl-CoA isomerase